MPPWNYIIHWTFYSICSKSRNKYIQVWLQKAKTSFSPQKYCQRSFVFSFFFFKISVKVNEVKPQCSTQFQGGINHENKCNFYNLSKIIMYSLSMFDNLVATRIQYTLCNVLPCQLETYLRSRSDCIPANLGTFMQKNKHFSSYLIKIMYTFSHTSACFHETL